MFLTLTTAVTTHTQIQPPKQHIEQYTLTQHTLKMVNSIKEEIVINISPTQHNVILKPESVKKSSL